MYGIVICVTFLIDDFSGFEVVKLLKKYFDFYPLPAKMIRFDLRICSSKLGLNKKHHQFLPTLRGKKPPEISKWDPKFFRMARFTGP